VAMAFDYFRKEHVDIAVIEVGLGGRLDSTNIILPELSVITNIGWDHMNILGNSIEEIALEKSGIIKTQTPVITGWNQHNAADFILSEVAAKLNAPLIHAATQFSPFQLRTTNGFLEIAMRQQPEGLIGYYTLDLLGHYQQYNLSSVLAACKVLLTQGWEMSDQHIQHALRNTKKITGFSGRYEIIHHHPDIILDVAHNEDGIRELVQQFSTIPENAGLQQPKLHIILGMVKDKDIDKVLSMLPQSATYYFTNASIPRAMPVNMLSAKARSRGLLGMEFDDVNQAIDASLQNAKEYDTILVCGSVFVVGEVNVSKYSTQEV